MESWRDYIRCMNNVKDDLRRAIERLEWSYGYTNPDMKLRHAEDAKWWLESANWWYAQAHIYQ